MFHAVPDFDADLLSMRNRQVFPERLVILLPRGFKGLLRERAEVSDLSVTEYTRAVLADRLRYEGAKPPSVARRRAHRQGEAA